MQDVKIILLSDVQEQRKRRLKEIEMYTQKKKNLEFKIEILRRDLQLTELLIKMIEKETSANSVNINAK